jgi:RNA-binding protein 8A
MESTGKGSRQITMKEDDAAETYQSLDATSTDTPYAKSVEGYILCITGINEEAQEEDLQDAFSAYGQVKNLHLNLNRRTGYVKGYAFLEFETAKEAKKAIEKMNGHMFLG